MKLERVKTIDNRDVVIGFKDWESCVEYARENGEEIVELIETNGWYIKEPANGPIIREISDYECDYHEELITIENWHDYYERITEDVKEMLYDSTNISVCARRLENLASIEWYIRPLEVNQAIMVIGEMFDKVINLESMDYEDKDQRRHAVGVILPE